MTVQPRTFLIAIVGGSGAGKGWFVERLCRVLGDKACHLEFDHFYRDLSHLPLRLRQRHNFDVPDAIDWAEAGEVLRACKVGDAVSLPSYNFATHCRSASRTEWTPRPLILVDGLWLLQQPKIRELFALKIYLDTPAELRRTRRLTRDVTERGYTRAAVERQLRMEVAPMHDRYVEPQKQWADLILTQPFQEAQLSDLSERLWPIMMSADVPRWEHETFCAKLISNLAHHEYCS
jgi:uridine kinase